ncbi:hypothetical protein ACFQSB_27665 [Sphaerisporangium rhizosphaerae]|uniref:Uncharacterized protein n=1 Tax=Sphaerisporangium rhizosphaerae TaxID=2269375 RepID=A0ABW2PCR1_9ACTN
MSRPAHPRPCHAPVHRSGPCRAPSGASRHGPTRFAARRQPLLELLLLLLELLLDPPPPQRPSSSQPPPEPLELLELELLELLEPDPPPLPPPEPLLELELLELELLDPLEPPPLPPLEPLELELELLELLELEPRLCESPRHHRRRQSSVKPDAAPGVTVACQTCVVVAALACWTGIAAGPMRVVATTAPAARACLSMRDHSVSCVCARRVARADGAPCRFPGRCRDDVLPETHAR